MKKVLIAYDSRTGKTEKMAEGIAEGVRMGGHEAELKKITQLKNEEEVAGYDAYVFGSPTYHRDMIGTMKSFLFLAQKANLAGKVGGAIGSYTHSGDEPAVVFDTMAHVFKMDMTNLGSCNLTEDLAEDSEGLRACHDYGEVRSKK